MVKSPEAFLTIGEMAERLGVKTHILRYWEEQFPMLKPVKRAGGRRLYRPSDAALLDQINDLLHKQGYTIKGARGFLSKNKTDMLQSVPDASPASNGALAGTQSRDLFGAVTEVPSEVLSELKKIRNRLASALEAA